VRERTLSPYTVEYWKSLDYRKGSFPISLRWPWLYVRLSPDVKRSRTLALVPDRDVVSLPRDLPRYPRSVALASEVSEATVYLTFVAEASESEIIDYHAGMLPAVPQGALSRRNHGLDVDLTDGALPAFGNPQRFQVEADAFLYGDDPLVIYSAASARRIPPDADRRQPDTLRHLPDATRYRLRLTYRDATHAKGFLPAPKR
jgi:hypothetical protein